MSYTSLAIKCECHRCSTFAPQGVWPPGLLECEYIMISRATGNEEAWVTLIKEEELFSSRSTQGHGSHVIYRCQASPRHASLNANHSHAATTIRLDLIKTVH